MIWTIGSFTPLSESYSSKMFDFVDFTNECFDEFQTIFFEPLSRSGFFSRTKFQTLDISFTITNPSNETPHTVLLSQSPGKHLTAHFFVLENEIDFADIEAFKAFVGHATLLIFYSLIGRYNLDPQPMQDLFDRFRIVLGAELIQFSDEENYLSWLHIYVKQSDNSRNFLGMEKLIDSVTEILEAGKIGVFSAQEGLPGYEVIFYKVKSLTEASEALSDIFRRLPFGSRVEGVTDECDEPILLFDN